MKYEKLWRYLFNQFFCGNLDRLGGNMSDLMEEALSHNITHLTRERTQFYILGQTKHAPWHKTNHAPMTQSWEDNSFSRVIIGPFQELFNWEFWGFQFQVISNWIILSSDHRGAQLSPVWPGESSGVQRWEESGISIVTNNIQTQIQMYLSVFLQLSCSVKSKT